MAVPSFIDSQTQDSGSALSITFNMSTITHTTDDFLIAFVKQSENTTQRIWDDDGGGGNGWTREAYNRTTGGRDQETAVYWKFATSSSESNPTFTWASGITAEPMSGALLVYRGVDTVAPFTELTWQWAQNDGNPPNPDVRIDFANTRVVCCHNATHDDISSVAAPTGFTLRTQVWNGTSNDHRNHFTADIEVDTTGTYSPPDWQHSVLNTTPEYQTYSIALNEVQPIHLTGGPTSVANDATNQVFTGDGFGATQGTGKIELWSDPAGTSKVTQTVDSWSDTSIQIDIVPGALADTLCYIVVTNDSGDQSNPRSIKVGSPYAPQSELTFDHFWTMQNTKADSGVQASNPLGAVEVGPPQFVTSPKVQSASHSLRFDNNQDKTEVADSAYTNITNQHTARDVGGWVQLNSYQELPAAIYEEGGGVNNFYMICGFGNKVLFNVADSNGSPAFKVQAYSDTILIPNRWYHVHLHFEGGGGTGEFIGYVDGVEVSTTDGNPITDLNMSTHSGDWSFGRPDGNLDTGGTDIQYNSCVTMYLSHWGTASAVGGGAPFTATEIREELFEKGIPAEHTIAAGTEAAMQTAIEAFDTQTHSDTEGLTYQIPEPTGGGDLTLALTDQFWDPESPSPVSCHIRWAGGTGDELTVRNVGTSNASIAATPNGGTVVFVPVVPVTVTVRDINTGAPIENARVLMEAARGGKLLPGQKALDIDDTAQSFYLWSTFSSQDITVAESSQMDVRFDLMREDWDSGTRHYADNYELGRFFSATTTYYMQFNSSGTRQTTTNPTALGLVDGERAQIRVVANFGTDTANWYVRTGSDLKDLADDDWGAAVVAGATLSGSGNRAASTTADVELIASSTLGTPWDGQWYGYRVYDSANTAVDYEVYADDLPDGLPDGVDFTTTNGDQLRIYKNGTQAKLDYVAGDLIIDGVLTDVNGEVTAEIDYEVDQPVTGRVRKAGTAPLYQTAPISATIGSTGLDLTILMIPDE